ncbi:hypothetical protein [Peptostreptococcus anaerobius]|uniref:hypothetical protein n=1 Tax=Peptostreptococcus anaerobius TaxID=1261 RepID=UPI002430EE16|nr:hypothetical protein [Peptostreptococcus anaerobius]
METKEKVLTDFKANLDNIFGNIENFYKIKYPNNYNPLTVLKWIINVISDVVNKEDEKRWEKYTNYKEELLKKNTSLITVYCKKGYSMYDLLYIINDFKFIKDMDDGAEYIYENDIKSFLKKFFLGFLIFLIVWFFKSTGVKIVHYSVIGIMSTIADTITKKTSHLALAFITYIFIICIFMIIGKISTECRVKRKMIRHIEKKIYLIYKMNNDIEKSQ